MRFNIYDFPFYASFFLRMCSKRMWISDIVLIWGITCNRNGCIICSLSILWIFDFFPFCCYAPLRWVMWWKEEWAEVFNCLFRLLMWRKLLKQVRVPRYTQLQHRCLFIRAKFWRMKPPWRKIKLWRTVLLSLCWARFVCILYQVFHVHKKFYVRRY